MRYTPGLINILTIFSLITSRAPAQSIDEQNLFRLAQTYEQAGQWETALRYYKDLFQRQPANANYFEGLRRSYTQLKKYPELVAFLEGRIKIFPQDIMIYAYLGSAFFRMEREDDAYAAWERAININPLNTSTYRLLADQAIDNKLYHKAVEYLLRGRKAGGNSLLFVPDVARAYVLQLKFDDAMQEYVNLLLENPASLGEVERQITQFAGLPHGIEAAERVVKDACEDHRNNVTLRYLRAWLAMERKNYNTAYEVYQEIDEMQNSNGVELMNFARRAFDEKSYDVAMKAFQHVAKKHHDQHYGPEAEFFFVRCIEVINEQNDSTVFHSDSGTKPTSYASTEAVPSYAGAISLYEEIAYTYPKHPVGLEAKYRIGYLKFFRFFDTDGAMSILQESSELRRRLTGNPDGDILIGDIFLAQGKLDQARDQYQRVTSMPILTPNQAQLLTFKLAELDYFEAKFDDALQKLQPLSVNSNADIANDALLLSLHIIDNRKPTDAPLKEYAHAALFERQRKYSEAAAILQNIIVNFPSAIIVDRSYIIRASLERKSGQSTQALETLQTFLTKFPESILRDQAQFDLAELYQTTCHDKARALELYQTLLKDFPNSLLSGEARRRILFLRQANL